MFKDLQSEFYTLLKGGIIVLVIHHLAVLIRNKFSEIIKTLPISNFVRIHKSHIVNIAYIKVINATKKLIDNDE